MRKGDVQTLRRLNRRAILNQLRRGPLSRADLARATGQEVAWDDGALACSWEAINFQLPEADRTPQWDAAKAYLPPDVPWEDPFANAVDVADDAPLIDKLVAWNGRTP